jgi:hypothetical protein
LGGREEREDGGREGKGKERGKRKEISGFWFLKLNLSL